MKGCASLGRKNTKGLAVGAFIFIVIGAACAALFGWVMAQMFNTLGDGNASLFYRYLLIMVILLAGQAIAPIIEKHFVFRYIGQKIAVLKEDAFRSEMYNKRGEGTDISNFSTKIDQLYQDNLYSKWIITNRIMVFLFSSIAIIALSPQMYVAALVVSLIPLSVPNLFKNKVQAAAGEFANDGQRYLGFVSDTLKGRLEVVKYDAFDSFNDKHKAENHLYEDKRYKSRLINFAATMVTNASALSMIIGIILVGGMQALSGTIEVGTIVGVVNLMNNIVIPIAEISAYRNAINSTKPVMDEFVKFSNMEVNDKKVLPSQIATEPLIAQNISFAYPGSDEVLFNGFNHVFEKGKKYLIRGESGSGKTTLAKILSGELEPTNGSVKVNDKIISTLNLSDLNRIVTYVEQQSYVFKDSIWNNIDFYRDSSKEKIQDIISKMKLQSLDIHSTIDDESGVSGGQKARISLGRALVELPNVLIVDEPTAGLDPDTATEIIEYITSLKPTVIMISHDEAAFSSSAFDEVISI